MYLNADNSSRAHYYNISMGAIPYSYSCIGSAYIPPNPFPTSCLADAVASLLPVPVGELSNTTSQRGPNSPTSHSHLSPAVTAGIAVGLILTASLLVISLCIIIYRKRKCRPHAEPRAKGGLPANDGDNGARGWDARTVDFSMLKELEDTPVVPEIAGRTLPKKSRGKARNFLRRRLICQPCPNSWERFIRREAQITFSKSTGAVLGSVTRMMLLGSMLKAQICWNLEETWLTILSMRENAS